MLLNRYNFKFNSFEEDNAIKTIANRYLEEIFKDITKTPQYTEGCIRIQGKLSSTPIYAHLNKYYKGDDRYLSLVKNRVEKLISSLLDPQLTFRGSHVTGSLDFVLKHRTDNSMNYIITLILTQDTTYILDEIYLQYSVV